MVEFFSKKRMLARYSVLEQRRSAHINDWKKITQVIRPTRGIYLSESAEDVSKRPTSMLNSTPAIASRTLQSGMIGGASSPAYQWFKFELDDTDMQKWGPAKIALEQREAIVQRFLAQTNFYQQLQTIYGDAADFGNGCGIIDIHPRERFTTKVFSPGEYVIDVDDAGDINCIISKQPRTVMQLVSRYGLEKVSQAVKDHYNNGKYSQPITVIQVIEENIDVKEGRLDWKGKPFVKFIFEESVKEDGERFYLDLSGYNEWPGFDLRWDIASGNIWGQGPGLLALGDAAALQTLEFRDAQLVEKAVKPPLQAPALLKNRPISHAPGGVTYYDPFSSNGAKVEPIYNIQPGVLGALDAKIQRAEQRINEVYFKDLFLMLATTDRREITAREVEEKHEEKLISLGPVLQRTHRDALGRAIIRVYRILDEAGAFPEAPPELKDRQLSIRYTSALAYAQRAAGATSLERFFGFTGNLIGVYPEIRSKVNPMKGVDYYADAIGVPAEVMVTDEEAQGKYQQEQQAAAMPEQAAAVKDLAGAGQLLSQTDTARPSALNYLLQRGGLQ